MNYCNIKDCDISNGLGVRVSLFVSGCRNRCVDCFQPETWDFNYGKIFTLNEVEILSDMIDRPYIKGLSILGGEPLEPENLFGIYQIVTYIKKEFPNKDIWLYTGFTFEELCDNSCRVNNISEPIIDDMLYRILSNIDIMVDGRFDKDLKDITLKFRGSSNQRIIDMKKTLKENKVILLDI